MNDNHELPLWRQHEKRRFEAREAKQIAELSQVAERAVVRPESLTMGEVQEVGWGFLLMAKERANRVVMEPH